MQGFGISQKPLALNGTSALSRLLKLFTKMSKFPGLMQETKSAKKQGCEHEKFLEVL